MENAMWTDEALRDGRNDTLGRLPYAQRAAELIHTTHSFESSAVFGLSGPWGSGKTSLVNMIVEDLKKKHSEWDVARFTPWATSDVMGLLGEFYSSIAEVLPKKKGRRVRKALAVTASVAAPAANLIPYAGSTAAEGIRMAGEALAKLPSWEVAFGKASKELKDLQKPILVVVDDIDRLHGDELLALLRVVRLLGRFNGVHYILAYDDETLYRSMISSNAVSPHDGSAERFMEKIVQYPLFVPPLLQHQQISRLNSGFNEISRQTSEDGLSIRRISGLIDCFTDLLTTPRAIDRYIAQLRHHIPLLPPEEVDDEDVQLLTLIRVSFPSLFNLMPRYRSELTSGHTGEIKFADGFSSNVRFDVDPLLEVVPDQFRRSAQNLLVSLFPKIAENGKLTTLRSHRRQSVQHEEYFDRYFAMGILDHDVSDRKIELAVTSAIAGDAALLRELLIEQSDELRSLVLSKCLDPTNQPSTSARRIQLAEVLVPIANDLTANDNVFISDQERILTWIADLLVGSDKETSEEKIRTVIWKFNSTSLRIRAWNRLEHILEDFHSSRRPSWYDQVTGMVVDDSIEEFLEHLKQGDDAETRSGIGDQVHFILRYRAEKLRTAVRQLFETKDVDLSTLASRLTSARTLIGTSPDWQLSPDFEQEAFNQIAPPGDDPWYHEPVQQVDLRDLSWANRRKFVTGRVSPPLTDAGERDGPE